jgi:D-glycero-alpha-D-manno-heptose-7-phosphate kinase
MATSSAFTVGLLKACTDKSNKEIAGLATVWERDKLEGNVGVQDQYICAVGGFHRLRIYASGIVDEPLDYDWLEPYMMLFDTGQYRRAGNVVRHQLDRIEKNQSALHQLKRLALHDYPTCQLFGEALCEAWKLKKTLSDNVSTLATDEIYLKALQAGAVGGKLLGAGGGGFILFVVEPDKQPSVRESLKLNQIDIKFEGKGSQIIYDSRQPKS